MPVHIVWDWNGTLKDDQADLLAAVNHTLQRLHTPPIDLPTYQTQHILPVRRFYTRLVNRPLTDDEWAQAQTDFASFLRSRPPRLRAGAEQVLARVRDLGHSQSLLSLYPEDLLRGEVRRLGIADFFTRIDGRRGPDGTKEHVLTEHLKALPDRLRSRPVLVIGDTADDGRAACAVGAHAVLHTGGLETADRLRATLLPVTESLDAAVDLGLRGLAGRAKSSAAPAGPHRPLPPGSPGDHSLHGPGGHTALPRHSLGT
ncbi:HAD family hydrolase [Streptomyces acidiscabies]|uniref:HAD hydrolase-like protein n=1 Tax=Streptomyces acidiscabies TaxID=42234 RepID=A0AAP6EKJ4_9ACTN|nr:HAD hydrolase-like protein [Streptomyces acidiscabies]MBP5935415.1 HAD family hydrolase [Streptomyces sp. LBUM 1476]MBZ3916731.1 HAD family hydrolase [Streptomyces acidiscabies]MDX2965631.1 HAD hydrolase-like protein [Streptomyces acidiscabies]MDX3024867.1 HAD hydrolase-like protein [Streptomyces acidiscabies]MDX3795547.1 HAD hydrolase-like protein [Streptomyces acidiscabies]